jgi:hypothetical protein
MPEYYKFDIENGKEEYLIEKFQKRIRITNLITEVHVKYDLTITNFYNHLNTSLVSLRDEFLALSKDYLEEDLDRIEKKAKRLLDFINETEALSEKFKNIEKEK